MANSKLSALTELAAAPATNDEFYVRDESEGACCESKRITWSNIFLNANLPGTLDVTGATTLDSTLSVAGVATLTSQLDVESYMAVGNGSALCARKTLIVDRDFTLTGSFSGEQIRVSGKITSTGTSSFSFVDILPDESIINSGNVHTSVSSLTVREPNITETSGSVTTASTVQIVNAPTEGCNNYALLVSSGAVQLCGTLGVCGATTLGSTLGVCGATTLSSTLNVTGAYVFNEAGSDIDGRFEGVCNSNLLVLDGGLDVVAIGGAAVSGKMLSVYGTLHFPCPAVIETGCGDLTITPAGVTIIGGTVRVKDNNRLVLGCTNDMVMTTRSTTLCADTALANKIEGCPDHQGLAANSAIYSNITNNSDVMMLVSDGGNSLEFLKAGGNSGACCTPSLSLGWGISKIGFGLGIASITRPNCVTADSASIITALVNLGLFT